MKKQSLSILTFSCVLIFASSLWAKNFVSLELAQTYQSKNDQRVPGDQGDEFSLTDFSKGPFFTQRIYLGYQIDSRQEIRALYAPLEITLDSQFSQPVRFLNSTFAANSPTTAFYKFNSYRLTYSYLLEPYGDWNIAVGFTGKIRDAEVRLEQGSTRESKKNVGFVPLAHAHGTWAFAPDWNFNFDIDALGAPQGRAIDLGLFIQHQVIKDQFNVYGGYRMVEGGADNDEVYNFSWFHSATLGLQYYFNEHIP